MVFFTCNTCGESLKKNQVEKHYMHKCRNCQVLTCVDCHRDFPGDTYQGHTKCITEDQKYSAKGWTPKASANKGEKKQQQWINNLQTIVDTQAATMDPDTRRILDTIMQHDNIPRKKAKFVNFIKNILRHVRPATIDNTWELFEAALKPSAPPPVEAKPDEASDPVQSSDLEEAPQAQESRQGVPMFSGTKPLKSKKQKKKDQGKENEATTNGTAEEASAPPSKGQKRRRGQDQGEAAEDQAKKPHLSEVEPTPTKFVWEDVITSLLTQKGSMKVNKLKKKVVNEYLSQFEDTHKTQAELMAKVDKKLRKSPNFKVLKDVVSLPLGS